MGTALWSTRHIGVAREFGIMLAAVPSVALLITGSIDAALGHEPVLLGNGDDTPEFSIAQTFIIPGVLACYAWLLRSRTSTQLRAIHLPAALLAVVAAFGVNVASADAGVSAQVYFALPIAYAAFALRPYASALVTMFAVVANAVLVSLHTTAILAFFDIITYTFMGISLWWLVTRATERSSRHHATWRWLIDHDGLTGLASRPTCDAAIARLRDNGVAAALCVVDVDAFKTINDTYGHATGDLVLQDLATVLRYAVPQDAVCARIGGDEFVVTTACPNEHSAEQLAAHLVEVVRSTTFRTDQQAPLALTVSVGVAWAPGRRADRAALYAAADAALLETKRLGRKRVTCAAERVDAQLTL